MERELIYIGDPMCSWCYGFYPVIDALYKKHKDEIKMTLVVGGLRVGDEHVVDQARIDFLKEHWVDIGDRSGQKFSLDILENTGWIYNTEWACRAVVVMRNMSPDQTYAFFGAVQANFYAKNIDPSKPETYADEAVNFGVDRDEFLKLYNSAAIKEETAQDFVWSQEIGATGFPTVLLKEGDKIGALTLGYQTLENLEKPLAHWIEHGFEKPAIH